MSRVAQHRLLTALLALALGVSALAVSALAKPVKARVILYEPAKLGNQELKAGDYSVVADGTKVTLLQNDKVVAETAGKWVDAGKKEEHTSVLLDNGQIREFRFQGQKQHLVVD